MNQLTPVQSGSLPMMPHGVVASLNGDINGTETGNRDISAGLDPAINPFRTGFDGSTNKHPALFGAPAGSHSTMFGARSNNHPAALGAIVDSRHADFGSGPGTKTAVNNEKSGMDQNSIISYLGEFFHEPIALLSGMAKANLILSGSRAVEPFFPGSSGPDSDFDFYVDASARCVGEAIVVLQAAGVIFDLPYQQAIDIAQAPRGSMSEYFYTDKKQLERLLSLPDLPPAAAGVLLEMLETLADTRSKMCTLYSGAHVHMIQGRLPGSYGYSPKSIEIISGTTSFGPKPLKVQLIFASGKSPLTHVFDFYATCVQAVITGFGAVHLYHDLGRSALYWPSNTQNKKSAEAAVLKYISRGFTFTIRSDEIPVLRRLRHGAVEDKQLVLFRELPLKITPELFAVRQAFLQDLVWLERAGETTHLSQPPAKMRDILAKERRQRIALRATGVRDDISIDVASRYSVSFAKGRGSRHPNEIAGL